MAYRVAVFVVAFSVASFRFPGAGPGSHAHAETELGTYETQALDRALARTGLEIEPEPDGKRLGTIHVVNLDVFSPRDGFLQFFNIFHRTTREEVVRREVRLDSGQIWDQAIVDETARRLRDPVFTTLVVIVPVRAADGQANRVDMLVVTRDVWSLRLNSEIEFQQSKLSYLLIAPSENNFLGLRKLISAVFEMDLGEFSTGLLYLDRNFFGHRLRLSARGEAIFGRASGELEGERATVIFERPFWSLASRWSGGISAFHEEHVFRIFRDTALDDHMVGADSTDCAGATAPIEYNLRRFSVKYAGNYRIGQSLKHRFTAGHLVSAIRPTFLDDFPADPCLREDFERTHFPRSERTSQLFVEYGLFEPNFARLRNFNSFDLAEDVRFGPNLVLGVAFALEPIGSESTFTSGEIDAGWTIPWSPGGFFQIGVELDTRVEDGEFIDNIVQVGARVVTPMIADLFRIIARGDVAVIAEDKSNVSSRVRLGGQNGLRGFAIGQFPESNEPRTGDGFLRFIGNIELRTAPIKIGFTRAGALVFFDAGDATYAVDNFRLHADIGIGLRGLIPQLSPLVYRLDWALPLDGSVFPGRVIFSTGQAF
ncbi:MAG: hypothetical protein MJE77_08230 [Proteobacteria bacterium]|nr:hypothetical protein [Pseudomonadota bacterium]